LLERLGLQREVAQLGTSLDTLTRLPSRRSWSAPSSERPSLVAIRPDRLEALVARRLSPQLRTTDRAVKSLRSTADGVQATFEGRIEKSVDAVVSATPTLVPGTRSNPTPTLHTWTLDWPASSSRPAGTIEAWTEDVAGIVTPVPDGATVRVLATPAAAPSNPIDLDRLAAEFDPLFESIGTPFDACTTTPGYRRVGLRAARSLRTGPIARIGPAARSPPPGALLEATLGLEDGWLLARAFAGADSTIEAAIADYEATRRARSRDLQGVLHGDRWLDDGPRDLSPVLAPIRRARERVFGHASGAPVPDRLKALTGQVD
jgi:2-polyprenyl-6-methoxyphenol hydroxylase-like FAD-dependent oxidoreductase